MIETALSYLGTPYIWGGDDPSGFDCSGFVIECLRTVGIVSEKEDYTADALYYMFLRDSPLNIGGPILKPDTGRLIFGFDGKGSLALPDGKATHVVICLDEKFQIGASGGTRHTSDPQKAWRDNAYIKIRPIVIAPNIKIVDPFL